ncbi:MAG: 50S ribosomal protein L9 [Planctomycetota bacterium]|nr:50S ribosomal protein L9 [Planctomycetota bacterium]
MPYGFAYPYSDDNIKRVEAEKKLLKERELYHLDKMQELKQSLETFSCTLSVKATEEGRLFGSVTAVTIADELKANGLPVEPSMIALESPIKELGAYEVTIRLAEGVDAHLRVWVVEKEDAEKKGGKKEESDKKEGEKS